MTKKAATQNNFPNANAKPVICYQLDNLPAVDSAFYQRARNSMTLASSMTVAPRDGGSFNVKAGQIFRITCPEGPQVGDLNLWNANNINERFFSGKTRQLHATHVTTGDRLWTNLPFMRYLATITHDTLEAYGFDKDGAGIHDVIGTRCDPYTNHTLNSVDYHHCCHSNLLRAFSDAAGMSLSEAEPYIHDVLNVFMCTGFTKDTHQYFMKASPVRQGDYIEMFAEIDLLGVLSACPGGDCSASHSDDATACYPLGVEIYDVDANVLADWQSPEVSGYNGAHRD